MLSTLLLKILSMLHFGPIGCGGLGSCEKESLLCLLCISLGIHGIFMGVCVESEAICEALKLIAVSEGRPRKPD